MLANPHRLYKLTYPSREPRILYLQLPAITCNPSQFTSQYILPNLASSADITHRLLVLTMILTSPIDLHKHVDPGSVEGKTILITGGASSGGIGFGVAEAMAENGYV